MSTNTNLPLTTPEEESNNTNESSESLAVTGEVINQPADGIDMPNSEDGIPLGIPEDGIPFTGFNGFPMMGGMPFMGNFPHGTPINEGTVGDDKKDEEGQVNYKDLFQAYQNILEQNDKNMERFNNRISNNKANIQSLIDQLNVYKHATEFKIKVLGVVAIIALILAIVK